MLTPLTNSSASPLPCNAAIIIPTVLRPSLARAVQSVFDQDLDGTLQILIGIDACDGDRSVLDRLSAACPSHIRIDVLEPGYSTAFKRGGLYPCRAGGALRTILSYLANSLYVAYLDDDNWWAPTHLSSLLSTIKDADWAFSHRWFVEWETQEPISIDRWESVGVDAGVFAARLGGFVDTSSLMLNKLACHEILPHWSRAAFPDGTGEDRIVFDALKTRPARQTGQATSFYVARPDDAMAANRLQLFRENGIVLPSQRRSGITTLAAAIAPFREIHAPPPGAADADADKNVAAETDLLLTALVEQLKPREILSFAAGESEVALDLAAICKTAKLDPLIAVFDPPLHLAGTSSLVPLDASSIASVAHNKLVVDLVHITGLPIPALSAVLDDAWGLLRGGGVVLGEGEAVAPSPLGTFLAEFATSRGAVLLPASMQDHHRWILQKG